MKIWITLLICGMSLLGAETDEDQTFQLKNGRFWVHLDADQRTMFLVGLQDGWTLRGDTEAASLGAVFLVWGAKGLQYSELSDMVTLAYKQPENLVLPISWVVMANFAVQRGDTTRDVALTALRKFLNRVNSAPQGPQRTLPVENRSPIFVILDLKKAH